MVEIINKNNMITKIRSKYVIIKIFEHLNQNRLVDVIHYNKMYQKMMNINLKFYKNEFSKIEIEIIPKENAFGKFINIKKNTRKNIHLFFNDAHPLNIPLILVTFLVLNLEKIISSKEEQPKNIELMFCISSLFNLIKFIFLLYLQLLNNPFKDLSSKFNTIFILLILSFLVI